MAEEYNMGSLHRLNEQSKTPPSIAEFRRTDNRDENPEVQEETASEPSIYSFDDNQYPYGDSCIIDQYHVAQLELERDSKTFIAPDRADYIKEDGNLDEKAYQDAVEEAKEHHKENRRISEEVLTRIQAETGLKDKASGGYKLSDGEKANAENKGLVSDKFKTLDSEQQKEALKSLKIDIDGLVEEKSEDGSIHYRSQDGTRYYKVGVDNDKTVLIRTTSNKGKINTEVFELNKFQAKLNPDANPDTNPDAIRDGIVPANFEIADENKLNDVAQSLGINMDDYSIAQSEDGTVHLRSNDGKKFFKVGFNPDNGETQIISTKIENGKKSTSVQALPDKSLSELNETLNLKQQQLEEAAPPNENNYGIFERGKYAADMKQWRESGNPQLQIELKQEIEKINQEINNWQKINQKL